MLTACPDDVWWSCAVTFAPCASRRAFDSCSDLEAGATIA
jgi:hypothetical protein